MQLPRRVARVRGAGVVEIIAACCQCGRPIEPSDFARTKDNELRGVCGGCHRDLARFNATWWETAR
jgi:hypothetical protein